MALAYINNPADWYFDGVYVGPPVPRSVFYRGRKSLPCHSFTPFTELRDPDEETKHAMLLAKRRKRRANSGAKKQYKPRRY